MSTHAMLIKTNRIRKRKAKTGDILASAFYLKLMSKDAPSSQTRKLGGRVGCKELLKKSKTNNS